MVFCPGNPIPIYALFPHFSKAWVWGYFSEMSSDEFKKIPVVGKIGPESKLIFNEHTMTKPGNLRPDILIPRG